MTPGISKVKRLADEEAARAEAEPGEGAEEDGEPGEAEPVTEPVEPEPPGEPVDPSQPEVPGEPVPPSAPQGAGALADTFDAELFEREAKRHERAVKKLFGEQGVEQVCSHCDGIGYLQGWHLLQVEPPTSDDYRGCTGCNTTGVVQTGSTRQGFELAECKTCGGRGYLERLTPASEASAVPGEGNGEAAEYGRPAWMGDPSIGAAPALAPVPTSNAGGPA